MLSPKRSKFRKAMKGRSRGRAKGGDSIAFGDFGLQATECGWVTARQIEAARIAITRHIKRGGKVYIRFFPDKPITNKGKGAPEGWVAVVKPGRIMYEVEGVDEATCRQAFHLAHHKLPIKTRVVTRDVMGL
jgi:large subunit ribosomal protein L16